jgi:hypothetical protein
VAWFIDPREQIKTRMRKVIAKAEARPAYVSILWIANSRPSTHVIPLRLAKSSHSERSESGVASDKRKAGLLIESADGIGFFLRPTPPEEPKEQDPEAALRRLWDAQGVSQERQDELIADTTAKAQPGAKIGPFSLGGKID